MGTFYERHSFSIILKILKNGFLLHLAQKGGVLDSETYLTFVRNAKKNMRATNDNKR